MASARLTIGEPQSRQNCRDTSWPVSVPTVVNEARLSPFTSSASRGTATSTENEVPVCFWHSVQWHTAVATGSASQPYVTAPHKQLPSSLPIETPLTQWSSTFLRSRV